MDSCKQNVTVDEIKRKFGVDNSFTQKCSSCPHCSYDSSEGIMSCDLINRSW